MKISDKMSNIIIGFLGSTPFYTAFDKEVFSKKEWGLVKWSNNKAELCSLVNKMQARWEEENLRRFVERLFSDERVPLENFFRAKQKFNGNNYESVEKLVKGIVDATGNISNVQNTRVSKILHILAPDLIPMIDSKQGKFIFNKNNECYDKKDRKHLVGVLKKFHQSFADRENINKIKEISKELNRYNIEIAELRIFELLIWLQTQCEIKEINMELVK